MALSQEGINNATTIIRVGESLNLDDQTIAAAIATALMETGGTLVNHGEGDRDSGGIFQQRPSQGWGTREEVMDPEYAAKRFFQTYTRAQGKTVLDRIIATQRPDARFQDRYANFFGQATNVFSDIAGRSAPTLDAPSVEKQVVPQEPGAPARTSGAPATDALPPNATPEQIDAFIRSHYPDVAPFLLNDEIRQLAHDAALNDLSPTELTHRFQQTTYYKTHGPTSQQFDLLIGTNPAAAGQAVDRAKNTLGDLFAKNGLNLDDAKLGDVAKQVIRNGWINTQGTVVDPGSVNDFLAFSLGLGGKTLTGEAGASADSLRAEAKSYGITMSQPTLDDWALKILQGHESADSFKNYVTNMAKTLWDNSPDVVNAIDKGRTLDQYFDPYKQLIGNALQMTPDSIDLFGDPRWQEITHHYDPALNGGKGGTRTMTLGEADRYTRSQPEFADNPVYKDTAAQGANQLLAWLGKVG